MPTQAAHPRNPYPTVDVIIELPRGGIVLVRRRNPPHGWALPGGFVSYGESCEQAAVREALEETGLQVELVRQLGTYSAPDRDPRFHTLSVVFVGRPRADAVPRAGSDAQDVAVFTPDRLPWAALCFDHGRILRDYLDGAGPCRTMTRLPP